MVDPTDDLSASGASPSVPSSTTGAGAPPSPPGGNFQEKMGESAQASGNLAKGNQPPTQESINQQMDQTKSSLNDIHEKLAQTNAQLKPSQAKLIKGKLQAAHAHLSTAAKALNITPTKPKSSPNPLEDFMNLTMSAQSTFGKASGQIRKIASEGNQIQPAQMLLLQTEFMKAQQNLEYSSMMISKVVEGFKTMINTQL